MAPRFHDDLYTMRGRLLAHDPTWTAFGGERTVMGRIPERDWLVRSARTRVTACRVRHAGPVMAALELDGVSCRLTQEVSLYAGERLVRFRERLPIHGGVAEAAIPPYGLITVRLKGDGTDGTF